MQPEVRHPMTLTAMCEREQVPVRTEAPFPPLRETSAHDALPIWLTREEVEALISLAITSPGDAHPHEEAVFLKLGDLMRAFSR